MVLDLVVGEEESGQLLERGHVVELLDLVVTEPKLFQCGGNILQVLNSPDVVAGKRKNFQVLKALHGHDLLDSVGGKRQLLTVLKLVDFVVESLEQVGKLARKVDLGGLLWRDS